MNRPRTTKLRSPRTGRRASRRPTHLLASAVTLSVLCACVSAVPEGRSAGTADGSSPSREAAYEQIVRRIFERAWSEEDYEGLEGALSDEARFHFRGRTVTTGLDDLKRVVAGWHEAFPDIEFTVEDLIAEGDLVAARLTFRGTHQGEWKAIAPTWRSIEVTMMMFFRFREGKIVELWEDYDEYGMRLQLGPEP